MSRDDDVFRRKKVVQGFTEEDLEQVAAHIAKAIHYHPIVNSKDKDMLGLFLNSVEAAFHILKSGMRKHKEGSS